MWRTANPLKVAATRGYGAEVDLEAENAAAAHERLLAHVEADRRDLRPPVRRPGAPGRPRDGRARDRRGRARRDVVVVPVGGGGLIAGVASAVGVPRRRGRAGGRGVADAPRSRPGSRCRSQPQSVADGLAAPFAGEHCLAVCARARRRGRARLRGRDRGGVPLPLRAREARRASRPERPRRPLSWPGRSPLEPGETVVAVVSGGNAAPETASAILASR